MKVRIADKFPEAGRAAVARAGVEVVYDPELNDTALTAAVRSTGADILVVRGTKVPAATLAAGRLSLVVRAGAGYDTIDVPAASARGIYVSNCPGKNAIAVAELTFALLLALDRRIPASAADLKAGRWNKAEYSKARGLFGRTLGLVGLGRIGQEVLGRARAFGMPVVAWSPSLTRAILAASPTQSHLALEKARTNSSMAASPMRWTGPMARLLMTVSAVASNTSRRSNASSTLVPSTRTPSFSSRARTSSLRASSA